MSSKIINLAYCFDKLYFKHAIVSAISSIVNVNNKFTICINFIHNNCVHENEEKEITTFFQEKYQTNVNFINIFDFEKKDLLYLKNEVKKHKIYNNSLNHFKDSIFYRLYIPKILQDIHQVIYLDSDTIITSDISELWNEQLDEHSIGCVVEPIPPGEPSEFRYNHFHHLEISGHYFNSGVLSMNLNKIKDLNLIERAWSIFNEKTLVFPDQDILNILFDGKYKILKPKYNSLHLNICAPMIISMYDYFLNTGKKNPYLNKDIKEAFEKPVICHFFGSYKPWMLPGQYFFRKELYWKYFNMSPWKTEDSIEIEKILLSQFNKTKNNYIINHP